MNFRDKTILITGATGSFGTAFIKKFLEKYTPNRIRIYSRDEHKQAVLLGKYPSGILDGFIGDVRDKDRLRRAMDGVDIVIHAAALKRVQSCGYNPFETVKTNIIGSMNVADCALDADVDLVLGISTDKAVAPLNLYGATKMCMEKLLINANNYRGKKRTKISCVRYGNIVGSNGSVVPIWKSQHDSGKPITITNVQATRFWFELDKAIDFVIGCLNEMQILSGGEVFIPKLPSTKIIDMYHAIYPDKEFTVIGDRIGDKLHETMVLEEEMKHAVEYNDRFLIMPEDPKWSYQQPKGDYCGERTSYRSDNNNWFYSVKEIKERLEKI